jgi:hypothetical protein
MHFLLLFKHYDYTVYGSVYLQLLLKSDYMYDAEKCNINVHAHYKFDK